VFVLVIILIAVAASIMWWTRGGREFVQESVHPFRVTHIDRSAGTMTLVRGNRTYLVRCANDCLAFKAEGSYPMKDTGPLLEYRAAGHKLTLPIVEEETTFDVSGGRG
jgi:hypothetical protein